MAAGGGGGEVRTMLCYCPVGSQRWNNTESISIYHLLSLFESSPERRGFK